MWVALSALLGALGSAAFSARSASKSTAVEGSKVDAAAYDRAKEIYESALETLEEQLVRVRTRLDEVTGQLTQELDTSAAMRTQIRALQGQVTELEHTVADLRLQLSKSAIDPVPTKEGP
jgi:septal ring factor EnvC (AmiA/AmiB activator)